MIHFTQIATTPLFNTLCALSLQHNTCRCTRLINSRLNSCLYTRASAQKKRQTIRGPLMNMQDHFASHLSPSLFTLFTITELNSKVHHTYRSQSASRIAHTSQDLQSLRSYFTRAFIRARSSETFSADQSSGWTSAARLSRVLTCFLSVV